MRQKSRQDRRNRRSTSLSTLPHAERLEPRQLLAADAFIADHVLHVVGDDGPNLVEISWEEPGTAGTNHRELLKVVFHDLIVTKTFDPTEFDAVAVNMAGGDDGLFITDPTQLVQQGKQVTVDMGDGNDLAVADMRGLSVADWQDRAAAAQLLSEASGDVSQTLHSVHTQQQSLADELMQAIDATNVALDAQAVQVIQQTADAQAAMTAAVQESIASNTNRITADLHAAFPKKDSTSDLLLAWSWGLTTAKPTIQVPLVPASFAEATLQQIEQLSNPLVDHSQDAIVDLLSPNSSASQQQVPVCARGVTLIGGAGNDVLVGDSFSNRIYGGWGNDIMVGRECDDIIEGDVGNELDFSPAKPTNDRSYGGTGDDVLTEFFGTNWMFGDDGLDTLRGGDHTDLMFGGNHLDWMYGGAGSDLLVGGDGNDQMHGEDDSDTLHGGNGADFMYGDGGTDTMYGGADGDTLWGGTGNDRLFGDDGNDVMYGGSDRDLMQGGNGDDTLYGESGDDVIFADHGIDTIWGGLGNDYANGGAGEDTIYGEEGDDSLIGGTEADTIDGGDGGDRIWGQDGNDTLAGDGLNQAYVGVNVDFIYGDAGNDQIDAGPGDDFVDGGSGSDQIEGSFGNDRLYGGSGGDIIHGGDQNDQIWGGDGYDRLYGDNGIDTIRGDGHGDRIEGGDDPDNVFGGDETDCLFGNAGHDFISGDDGSDGMDGGPDDDFILGGAGSDSAWGGTGSDVSGPGSPFFVESWSPNGSMPRFGCVIAMTADLPRDRVEFDGPETVETIGFDGLSGALDPEEYADRYGVHFQNIVGATVETEGGETAQELDGYDNSVKPHGDAVLTKWPNNVEPFTIRFDQPVAAVGSFIGAGSEGSVNTLRIEALDNTGTVVYYGLVTAHTNADPDNREVIWGIRVDTNAISTVSVLNESDVDFGNALVFDDLWWFVEPSIQEPDPGDLNGDGSVDAADAGIMFANWGGSDLGDLNDDGIVDAADAGMLFANWTGDAIVQPQPIAVASAAAEPSVHETTSTRRRRRDDAVDAVFAELGGLFAAI